MFNARKVAQALFLGTTLAAASMSTVAANEDASLNCRHYTYCLYVGTVPHGCHTQNRACKCYGVDYCTIGATLAH